MIPSRFLCTVLFFASMGAASTSQAQAYKFHGADVGIAATGQFTTSITSQDFATNGAALPHQWTTESPGILFTLRDYPLHWASVELNYQYTRLDECFYTTGPTCITNNVHEGTAAALFHPHLHMRKLSPFVGAGGGALDFKPVSGITNQWRATGLVDVGFDMETHSNLIFRLGARDLIYRAPNYYNAGLASSRWVSTEEPYGGVYFKF